MEQFELTSFDKHLLNLVQEHIEFVPRPFLQIARELNTDEENVITRLQELKQAGFIRKMGAFFDSDKMGYTGTLVALRVKPEYLPQVVEFVNGFSGVTHNYQRRCRYNLWFTYISNSDAERQQMLTQVKDLPGVEACLDLYSRRKYKINVSFHLHD